MAEEFLQLGYPVAYYDLRHHGLNSNLLQVGIKSYSHLKGIGLNQNCEDLGCVISFLTDISDSVWKNKFLIVGHSYGGNVALEFALRQPDRLLSVVCIDGGYIDIQKLYPDFPTCLQALSPPSFHGMNVNDLDVLIEEHWCVEWTVTGKLAMKNNFHVLSCGMVIPKLCSVSHCQLLHNLWESRLPSRCSAITLPVLLMPAGSKNETHFTADKRADVAFLQSVLPNCRVKWMEDAGHDIPCQYPTLAVEIIHSAIVDGFLVPSVLIT